METNDAQSPHTQGDKHFFKGKPNILRKAGIAAAGIATAAALTLAPSGDHKDKSSAELDAVSITNSFDTSQAGPDPTLSRIKPPTVGEAGLQKNTPQDTSK